MEQIEEQLNVLQKNMDQVSFRMDKIDETTKGLNDEMDEILNLIQQLKGIDHE